MPKLDPKVLSKYNKPNKAKPIPLKEKALPGPTENKVGANVNGVWTYLSHPGMLLGALYSDYTHARTKACIDLATCRALYNKASKNEQKQMKEFVLANSHKVPHQRYWYLIEIRNLDTGHKLMCAGFKLDGPGLSLDQIKKVCF